MLMLVSPDDPEYRAHPADSETADPAEILARREITLGINLRGLVIPDGERTHYAITLNIDLSN